MVGVYVLRRLLLFAVVSRTNDIRLLTMVDRGRRNDGLADHFPRLIEAIEVVAHLRTIETADTNLEVRVVGLQVDDLHDELAIMTVDRGAAMCKQCALVADGMNCTGDETLGSLFEFNDRRLVHKHVVFVETGDDERGDMDENVRSAFLAKESEALAVVKKLHSDIVHDKLPQMKWNTGT